MDLGLNLSLRGFLVCNGRDRGWEVVYMGLEVGWNSLRKLILKGWVFGQVIAEESLDKVEFFS